MNRAELILQLFEAVPGTEYGYWIEDDGTIGVVNTQMGHFRYVRSRNLTQNTAFERGWIRVIVPRRAAGSLLSHFQKEKVTKKAINSLIRVFSEFSWSSQFWVEFLTRSVGKNYQTFDDYRKAIGFLRRFK